MKILLAVDGSPCSDEAVKEVARRPWPEGSEIMVLAAFELPIPPTSEGWALPAGYLDEVDRAARSLAEATAGGAVGKLNSQMQTKLAVSSEALQGPARSVILEKAESWGADLIVVGSHGYRAWERFLMGSVSQSVVSHAKCSVEVVRCRSASGGSGGLSASPLSGRKEQ